MIIKKCVRCGKKWRCKGCHCSESPYCLCPQCFLGKTSIMNPLCIGDYEKEWRIA